MSALQEKIKQMVEIEFPERDWGVFHREIAVKGITTALKDPELLKLAIEEQGDDWVKVEEGCLLPDEPKYIDVFVNGQIMEECTYNAANDEWEAYYFDGKLYSPSHWRYSNTRYHAKPPIIKP